MDDEVVELYGFTGHRVERLPLERKPGGHGTTYVSNQLAYTRKVCVYVLKYFFYFMLIPCLFNRPHYDLGSPQNL